ncbi:MAG: hypothetical protein OEZ14_05925 [Acidimicrobiia bacterium]|nr:hypothetical protein [Acidimicrobiia bacterium]MDH5520054.1 hypothetical protein [Acidimicrobiia bacterium]
MSQWIKTYWPIVLGPLLVAGAILSSIILANTSDVPNDPNIGGGILLLIGVVMTVAGLSRVREQRRLDRQG